jgi:hypothetical protein
MSAGGIKPFSPDEILALYSTGRRSGPSVSHRHGLEHLAQEVSRRACDLERQRIRSIDLDKLADAIFGDDRSPMQWHHDVAQDVIKVLFEEEPSILPIDPHPIEDRRASVKIDLPPDSNPMHGMGYGRNDD